MMERTNAKGAGVHWDIVLLCLINCLGAFIGGPWICAATVRAVAHVSSLVGILCFKFSLNPLRFLSQEKLTQKCQDSDAEQFATLQFLNNKIDPNQCQMTIFVQVYKIFKIVQLLALFIFVSASLMRETPKVGLYQTSRLVWKSANLQNPDCLETAHIFIPGR
jgi:hypothetical protein